MSTLTIIPPAVNLAIKPKPTKGEILTAMAMLHIEQCEAINKANADKKKALKPKIKAVMISIIKKDKLATLKTYVSHGYKYNNEVAHSVEMRIDFEKCTKHPELAALIAQYHEVDKRADVPTIAHARKIIKDRMDKRQSPDERACALIDSPESRKALESALAALE